MASCKFYKCFSKIEHKVCIVFISIDCAKFSGHFWEHIFQEHDMWWVKTYFLVINYINYNYRSSTSLLQFSHPWNKAELDDF